MTGLEVDLCFRGTTEAKENTKRDLTLYPGSLAPHTHGLGAARRGWSGRRRPIELRVFCRCYRWTVPNYGNSRFLGLWGPGRGGRKIQISLLIGRGGEVKGLTCQFRSECLIYWRHPHARQEKQLRKPGGVEAICRRLEVENGWRLASWAPRPASEGPAAACFG